MVNEWDRDDLPSLTDIAPIAASTESYVYFAAGVVLDAVVAHLNDHHPKPDASRIRNLEWEVAEHSSGARRAVNERDVMRRERDAAVERAEQLRDERDDALSAGLAEQLRDERDDALSAGLAALGAAERDRDEWKARAEAAERERDEARESADKWHGEWQKIAPARTVTRDEVEKAVRRYIPNPHFSEPIADEVCALFGVEAEPADPVEAKARELATIAYPEPGFDNAYDVADADARDAYWRIAHHLIEQEDRHVDQ